MAAAQNIQQASATRRASSAGQTSKVALDRRRSQPIIFSSSASSRSSSPVVERRSTPDTAATSRAELDSPVLSEKTQAVRACPTSQEKHGEARHGGATTAMPFKARTTSAGKHASPGSTDPVQIHSSGANKAVKHAAGCDLARDACAYCQIGLTVPFMAPEYAVMAASAVIGFPIGCAKTYIKPDVDKSFQGLRQAKKTAGKASYGMKASLRTSEYARGLGGNAIRHLEESGRITRGTGDKIAAALDPASTLLPGARHLELDPMFRYNPPELRRPDQWASS
jgi:hypothetical protein